ncbi:UNVERIFIED_CONTAM: hypothetical protein PYX00_001396 [Menopon gallinae]|uniref:Pre-rRNA-processing protein Ipi1 N-terminal domain-containing protein n=1 Tax=Menopon gallinae TaxID=328185 RepID=A0AAW2IDU0_9NEOP
MGKYKKKLRAEKAKVKLKKKKLPKGQNITDTSFKVKKIITVEQLKQTKENEPVSSWNVPLKDLLIHLGHHNKSSRLNGLNGIKEVLANYPDVLKGPTLKTTVMKVLECMTDTEKKIRTAAVNLLDNIFTQLDQTQISTFHELLNIHLACVMTHRQVEIQKDALKLTDIIIKHAPDAIRKNFKIIITNFIRILSSYKYGAQSEILLTKGSKKDLEENRISIFQRLSKILCVCYPSQSKECEDKLVINAKDAKDFSKRLFTRHLNKTPDLSEIFRPQGRMFNKEAFDDFEDDFKLLVSQVMPLLFESWAEFSPRIENNGFFEECVIKDSTAKLLTSILDIIVMLYDRSLCMERDDVKKLFVSSYSNQIIKSFLSSFPYTPRVLENEVTDFGVNGDVSAVAYSRSYLSQNLTVCYLAYDMKLKLSNHVKTVLDNYVLCALQVRNTKCEEILSKIVELMIVNQPRQKKKDPFLLQPSEHINLRRTFSSKIDF